MRYFNTKNTLGNDKKFLGILVNKQGKNKKSQFSIVNEMSPDRKIKEGNSIGKLDKPPKLQFKRQLVGKDLELATTPGLLWIL